MQRREVSIGVQSITGHSPTKGSPKLAHLLDNKQHHRPFQILKSYIHAVEPVYTSHVLADYWGLESDSYRQAPL